MAKKRGASGRTNLAEERTEEKSDGPKGLSKEAWIAIGTIVAALITGTVAVLTHVLPKAPPIAQPSPAASSTPVATSTSQSSTTTADTIAGRWIGPAEDSNGVIFQVALEVRKACALNDRCGVMSVSHVPCHGEIFLEKAVNGDFEFRVANFYGQSNRKVCQPGAGEHFTLQPDGKLAYSTTYEPKVKGVLDRIGK